MSIKSIQSLPDKYIASQASILAKTPSSGSIYHFSNHVSTTYRETPQLYIVDSIKIDEQTAIIVSVLCQKHIDPVVQVDTIKKDSYNSAFEQRGVVSVKLKYFTSIVYIIIHENEYSYYSISNFVIDDIDVIETAMLKCTKIVLDYYGPV